MNYAPTDLAKAQEALQRAQAERAKVIAMRGKTEENAKAAKTILRENHLARRIRESWMS